MVEDITPDLIEQINKTYAKESLRSAKLYSLQKKIENGSITLKEAQAYAGEVGNIRVKTFKNVLSSDVLPDGKMYYNIANRVVNETYNQDYELISNAATVAQQVQNKNNKIGLSVLKEDIDQENIDGIINLVSSKEYDEVSEMFEQATGRFARNVVDRSYEKNASFQYSAGLNVEVIRDAGGKTPCSWCEDLAGTYYYEDASHEVFQRHDNCKCEVSYKGTKLKAYAADRSNVRNTFRDY